MSASTKVKTEIAQSPAAIARMLGWQGSGSQTSPSYDTVVKACQSGRLRAKQGASGRNGPWRILPSDAIAWWNGGQR